MEPVREASWSSGPCLGACGMSRSRDCGRSRAGPLPPEGAREKSFRWAVSLAAGARGPYRRMKPGPRKSGSRAVATEGLAVTLIPAVLQFGPLPPSGPLPARAALRAAASVGGDPPGRSASHPPGGGARAGHRHLVPHAGGIPHLAGISRESGRAGRAARPHSPAAWAFLLAFSAYFLPRAHYQWSQASGLTARFAGFTLAPPRPPAAL